MHPSLHRLDHRPWPLPQGRWTMRQTWCDLLFAHWRMPAAVLRPLIPATLTLQEFDGAAWIGVVPFRMEGVMMRPLPDLPGISAFPEINVRTYVERDGKPGVWFFSLDATNALAVWAARKFFNLPYYRADITISESGDGFDYASWRRGEQRAIFDAHYRPTSDVYTAQPNTLEHFLTERYCLYAQSPRGRLLRTNVHHVPWPLQNAEAQITECSMTAPLDMSLEGPPALLHFSKRIDVAIWQPEIVAG